MVTTLIESGDEGDFKEADFIYFLRSLLNARYPDSRIMANVDGIDLILDRRGEYTIVEVKRAAPQTLSRVNMVAHQLSRLGERLRAGASPVRVNLVLAIPGSLSVSNLEALRRSGIDVWDRKWILASAAAVGMEDEAIRFIKGGVKPKSPSHAQALGWRLERIPPGRADWSAYQKLCGEILDHLFCPPLSAPIGERTNEAETNRRDFILPNYAISGFWAFLRVRYGADHVVVDAKNYTDGIKKPEVLQLANYLSLHGPGHFGLIVTRKGADNSALVTRREQWTVYNKMILILDDDDVKQMLESKDASGEPDLLIRQKIEDFRLSI
ncbi:hypothetical protein [Plantactinospora sp. B5E13]|uniref:hypothetical protein n=1 Tax=Plantactinospora sp. B5E13 TaxID=3153758 RepID=UPI00325F1F15